jgi:hypothetical protein
MARKAKVEHIPKQSDAEQRDQDHSKKFVTSVDVSSPVWRELAERARHLKSPRRQAEAESLRLFGEKHGLNRLRKAETAPPTPPEPTQSRAGRPRSIAQDQIDKGIAILQSQDQMSVKAARQTLREAGIEGEDGPLYRLIVKPAYGGMSK